MGRYVTRIQGAASNTVGVIYTAAAGGENTELAVLANGQTLSKAQYPALASFYSGQTEFTTLSLVSPTSGNPASSVSGIISNADNSRGNPIYGGFVKASLSGFTVYAQLVTIGNDVAQRYACLWKTTDGNKWSLQKQISLGTSNRISLFETSGAIYLNTAPSNGILYKTTDGVEYTAVYSGNPISHLTQIGNTIVFATGSTGVLTTTDFNSFTEYGIDTAFTPSTLINYSGVLYAFQLSATGVYYSTNSGSTWTAAASGIATGTNSGIGYTAKVVGDYIVASTYASGGRLYVYSSNPTGTTNTWTPHPSSKIAAGSRFYTDYTYDSVQNTLILCQESLVENSNNATFAYVISGGVTGTTVVNYSGKVDNLVVTTYLSSTYNYPFAISSGSTNVFYIGPYLSYTPTGASWSGATNVTPFISGAKPNPFFHNNSGPNIYGGSAYGTTNSGTRYIFKLFTSAYYSSGLMGIYVEKSGVFEQLKAISNTGVWSNVLASTDSGDHTWTNRPAFVVSEGSGKYTVAYVGSSAYDSFKGLTYNYYDQTTLTSTGRFLRLSGYGVVNSKGETRCGSVKNGHIYFIQNSGVRPASAGVTLSGFFVNQTGCQELRLNDQTELTALPASGFQQSIQFSYVSDSVIVSYSTTGATVTGAYIELKNGQAIRNTRCTIVNATGGALSVASGIYVFKSQGVYYTIDASGNLSKSYDGVTFTQFKGGLPQPVIATGATLVFNELSNDVILGPVGIKNKGEDVEVFTTAVSLTGSTIIRPAMTTDSYLRLSGNDYIYEYPMSNSAGLFSTEGTGVFTVPSIPATTTGTATYIIAR